MVAVSKCSLFVAGAILGSAIFVSQPAQAISHGKKQSDGMVCRELLGRPHLHYGEGKTKASKHGALADAVYNWSAFTRLEYGNRWKNWGIARKKHVACSGGGAAWRCTVKAMPCKH